MIRSVQGTHKSVSFVNCSVSVQKGLRKYRGYMQQSKLFRPATYLDDFVKQELQAGKRK